MVTIYYSAALALSVIFFMILWSMGHNQNISSMLMSFTCVILHNGGCLALSFAQNVEEALLANRVIYTASVFLPFFLLLNICQLLQVRIGGRKLLIMTVINSAVLFCTFSAGYTDWYYKSVSIDRSGGFTRLIKEYGPLHWIFLALLSCYVAAMVIIMIAAFFRQQKCSYKYASVLLASVLITFAAYFGQRLFGLKVELTAYVYLIEEVVIL
ncbi:MAG: histidine kinase N-terminal 7TM domain-containing protein, partial [Huintestinicola sp.]